MKLRRRELNVFSISALDLFASGMGAFVLLAVIAMPFFPNTGDSTERVEDLKGEVASAQARAQDLERVVARLQQSSDMEEAVAAALRDAQQQVEEMRTQMQELEERLAQAGDPTREREMERELASAQRAMREAQQRAQQLEATKDELQFPHLDLVICLDVTGSMRDQIEGLKREIASLAEVLDRLAPSVGVGIVAFGDRRWQRTIHQMPITTTASLERIQSFVNSLTANMRDPNYAQNLDGPEAVATALETAVAMSWRTASEKRYVIVITDNAAYPNRISAATTTARRFASQDDHFVSSVRAHVTGFPGESQTALRFLRDLAQAGNGNFVDAAGGESMLSTMLLAILGT